jgi:tetratricopeptide (TPR) repeat protein
VRGKGSFQARLLLAAALRGSGDLEAARDELVHVLTQEEPGFLPAASDLVDVLVALDADDDSLEQAIDEALGERAASVPANLAVGTRLHDAGRIAPAQRRYERILDASPSEARALLALSEIALGEGRVQDAWQLAMRVEPSDRLAAKAAQTAFLAAAASSRTDLLDEPARRIAEAGDALHAAERAVYVAWHRLLVPDEHVHVLVPQDDAARTAVLRNLEALARLEATEAFERLHPLLETVFDDEYQRRLHLARLYVRLRFPDLAGEEFMLLAQRFGPDAAILTGLGKVATMKDMWEDAHVFLSESLLLDPAQPDAERLLAAVAERCGA